MDRNDAVAASSAEARRAFYERIGALGMTPLWEVLGALVTAVHARVPVRSMRQMIYAYPTFHRAIEDALADLG